LNVIESLQDVTSEQQAKILKENEISKSTIKSKKSKKRPIKTTLLSAEQRLFFVCGGLLVFTEQLDSKEEENQKAFKRHGMISNYKNIVNATEELENRKRENAEEEEEESEEADDFTENITTFISDITDLLDEDAKDESIKNSRQNLKLGAEYLKRHLAPRYSHYNIKQKAHVSFVNRRDLLEHQLGVLVMSLPDAGALQASSEYIHKLTFTRTDSTMKVSELENETKEEREADIAKVRKYQTEVKQSRSKFEPLSPFDKVIASFANYTANKMTYRYPDILGLRYLSNIETRGVSEIPRWFTMYDTGRIPTPDSTF